MSLLIAGCITVAVTILMWYLVHKTKFGQINSFAQQTIIGVCFGLCAVYATELGSTEVNGAAINCRDAGPVIAGLLFGPWSGVLSGIIGAVDRYFIATPIFGIGAYTQGPCAIATLFAGCFAAFFKVVLFKKHRPYVLHSLVFIMITEVIHMGTIPLYHFDDFQNATLVMYSCFLPLVISNAAVVGVAFFITSFMDMRHRGMSAKDIILNRDIFFEQDLFFSFQFWLLVIIVLAFAVNVFAMSFFNDTMSLSNTQTRFNSELSSMKTLIIQDAEALDLKIDDMSRIFAEDWSDKEVACYFVKDNNTGKIISNYFVVPELVDEIENHPENTMFDTNINNTRYYVMYTNIENVTIISYSIEKYEMYIPHLTASFTLFIQILVFGTMMFCVFMLLKKLVGDNLKKINDSLEQITEGNLDKKVDVYSHKEFAALSDKINTTVDTLKDYIQAEANRFKEDFEMAHQIQLSALPRVFPPFPSRKELDIFARYESAKEVGGDFYDYYFVDHNTVAFLIADVSGKGIPAAMFMMRAKTAIRVFAEKHKDAAKTLEVTNNYLCDNNEAELFVTCWIGFIDLQTGIVQYSSAGHNPPIIIGKTSEECRFLKSPISLVLGGMENIKYKNSEYKLKPNEKILLYTDGISEAHDINNNLFTDQGVLDLCKNSYDKNIIEISNNIFDKVKKFQSGKDQFDDMTLLTFIYNGNLMIADNIIETELTLLSRLKNITVVCDRISEIFKQADVPKDLEPKFCVAVDEIFSNIVKYGYSDENNYITVRISIDKSEPDKNAVKVTFVDSADRFNPLDKSAPNTKPTAEEREIGGLGIYMVRKLMDDVFYIYKDKYNNLTVVKYYK